MSNKIAILGSGPSLYLFLQTKVKYDVVIGCNSLLLEPWFLDLENTIYVAHEPRLSNASWQKSLIQYTGEKYIADPLYSQIFNKRKKIALTNFLDLSKILIECKATEKYLSTFGELTDLKKNVVLDFCIPTAIFLNASNIDLYGCDFSYGTENTPNYFHKNGTIGSFVHSVETKAKWELASHQRFIKIINYLSEHKICTQRIMPEKL
jgi:hypothetical protein